MPKLPFRSSLVVPNFAPAVAYHFCLNLPEKFPQPGDHFLAPALYMSLDFLTPCFYVRIETAILIDWLWLHEIIHEIVTR